MQLHEVMQALEAAGTAQNRKIYARHGVRGELFGVSSAALKLLVKKIKKDQPLAEALWATGNYDARILATMIADPAMVSARTIDAWAKDVDCYPLVGALAGVVASSPHGQARAEKWRTSKDEWLASTGWNIVAQLALANGDLPDSYFEERLKEIEKTIHGAKNRVRHEMNQALIGIGCRNPSLTKQALAAAGRIGKVEVDHGETGCKTPDAAGYIGKVLARKKPN